MLQALCAQAGWYHSGAAREDRDGAFPLQKGTSAPKGELGWNHGTYVTPHPWNRSGVRRFVLPRIFVTVPFVGRDDPGAPFRQKTACPVVTPCTRRII